MGTRGGDWGDGGGLRGVEGCWGWNWGTTAPRPSPAPAGEHGGWLGIFFWGGWGGDKGLSPCPPPCPPGPCALQHGVLGTEVLLRCPAAGGRPAEWRRGGATLGTYPAPGLALPNASLAHEGPYSCHHPDTGETWARICLRLGCE